MAAPMSTRRVDRGWVEASGFLLLVADPDPARGEPQDPLLEPLQAAGVNLLWCPDGGRALVEFGRRRPQAVLVAPGMAGVETTAVVRAVREAGCRTVLVGIATGEADVVGPVLVAGATGVVGRPYDPAELVGRLQPEVHEHLQRCRLSYGPLELEPWAYRVRAGAAVLEDLPLKEFELLRLLMAHADRVVTPDQIRRALWGPAATGSANAITVHVGRLRARLAGVAELRTVRGLGYRLSVPSPAGGPPVGGAPVGGAATDG